MRRALAVITVLAALPGAGCGGRTPSDEEQVRDLLATFARATEQRDYQRLCDDVLAPNLLRGLQEIGLPCEIALRNSLGEVSEPKLTVGAIDIAGDRATAQIRTSAKGQKPSQDTLELARIEGAWKVSALGEGAEATPTPTPER